MGLLQLKVAVERSAVAVGIPNSIPNFSPALLLPEGQLLSCSCHSQWLLNCFIPGKCLSYA